MAIIKQAVDLYDERFTEMLMDSIVTEILEANLNLEDIADRVTRAKNAEKYQNLTT